MASILLFVINTGTGDVVFLQFDENFSFVEKQDDEVHLVNSQ